MRKPTVALAQRGWTLLKALGWAYNAWHEPYAFLLKDLSVHSFPDCGEPIGFYAVDVLAEVIFWFELGLIMHRALAEARRDAGRSIPLRSKLLVLCNASISLRAAACLPALTEPGLSCDAAACVGLLKLVRLRFAYAKIKSLKV